MKIEFTKEQLYEGESHKRLDLILSIANRVMMKYGGMKMEEYIQDNNQITAALVWDGYDSIKAENVTNQLQLLSRFLLKCESIFKPEDFTIIKTIIEPLEIVITELTLGYCD